VDDADLDATFPDLVALAQACRFRDCTHGEEPGCAIRAGVADGSIDPARLAAWERLRREAAYALRREDPEAARAERDRWKKIHLAYRARVREEGR
jgi:ribosome biogenesis GTPase